MGHSESGDRALMKFGIDNFENALSAVEYPIENPKTQTSLKVALKTLKMLSQLFNAPIGIRRPSHHYIRH